MAADLNSPPSPPLGLYVHLPWCVRKCPYCDFNSHQLRDEIPADAYIECLLADLEEERRLVTDRTVSTIYFGGGTPSLFSGGQVNRILKGIRNHLDVDPDAEISLEANPGTIERDSFSAYAQAGINRISLGAQSFDEGCLGRIGRIHGRSEIDNALESLHDSVLDNFNIDLMFGLPGQDGDAALTDVRLAIAEEAPHISHYQLTVEPNTAFAARPPVLPSDDQSFSVQEAASETLLKAGYHHYEISAWARPGRECRHNLNYWRYGDFIGIGAGAHGKLTDPSGQIWRSAKQRHPKRYMDGDRVAERRMIDDPEKVFEFFLNRLRLRQAILPEDFESHTGLCWSKASPGLEIAVAKGLLHDDGQGVRHTRTGWRFINDIQALFLP